MFQQDGAQVQAEQGMTDAGAMSGSANVLASYGQLSREGLQWKSLSARLQQSLLSQQFFSLKKQPISINY